MNMTKKDNKNVGFWLCFIFLGAVEVKIVKCFMSEINSLLYNSAFMELLWRGQSFKLNHSIWLQKKETALRRRNTGSFFCMENMIAKQFETIQDIFKKQVIQHYSIILQATNQIYCIRWEK